MLPYREPQTRLKFFILTSLALRADGRVTARHRKHIHSKSHSPRNAKRDDAKRGLNIGLQLSIPTSTETSNDIKMLEKAILRTLGQTNPETNSFDDGKKILEEKLKPENLLLKPFFQCDHWDTKTRTCWLDRNIGDTVTFSLSVKNQRGRPDIIWKKQFSQKDTRAMVEYTLDPKNSPRNVVIGRRGYELRISPITELDLDENQFLASFAGDTNTPHAQVNFKIRVMPEDLGFVYIGETLDLSVESHIALPLESMSFHWYTEKEGEFWTLPSNMRVSSTGLTLRISELRQEQEGIVACSIYANKGMHATKKRFLIRKPASKDVLNFSDPNIAFHSEKQTKRHLKINKRRNPHSKTEPKTGRKAANMETRAQREISEANFEGDHYTIVQDQNNEDSKLQTIKGYLANDGINLVTQDTDEKTLEGMNPPFGNGTDMETVLNINIRKDKYQQDDTVAQLISYCTRDAQCSNHASCIRTNLKENGFCRCLVGFYGPGIFCREDM